jgi:hypothetical protein
MCYQHISLTCVLGSRDGFSTVLLAITLHMTVVFTAFPSAPTRHGVYRVKGEEKPNQCFIYGLCCGCVVYLSVCIRHLV